jgi:hypothetical protein
VIFSFSFRASRGRSSGEPARPCGHPVPFGGDELLEPSHLALHGFKTVALKLEGVAVEPLAGSTQRRGDVFLTLLEPATPALEDAKSYRRIGLPEKGEPDAEAFVVPGGGTALGELLVQPFLAVGGQLVHVLLAASRAGLARGVVRGDEAGVEQRGQAGIQAAVGDRP